MKPAIILAATLLLSGCALVTDAPKKTLDDSVHDLDVAVVQLVGKNNTLACQTKSAQSVADILVNENKQLVALNDERVNAIIRRTMPKVQQQILTGMSCATGETK